MLTLCCVYQVVLWNMDNLQTENTTEEHKSVITDVRFRPNSSQLATSSVDKSVRLWDANNVSIFSSSCDWDVHQSLLGAGCSNNLCISVFPCLVV